MFCPLCKSEYQPGAMSCKDCDTPLVTTLEEAQGTPTSTLWEGGSQHELNQLVAGLQDAGIPCLSESKVGPDQMGKAIFIGFLKVLSWRFDFFRKYTANQMGWRIRVLQSDYPRANKLVVDLTQNTEVETD